MDLRRTNSAASALHPAASPALIPAVGWLAGVAVAPSASVGAPAAALLIALGLALANRWGVLIAALAGGCLHSGLQPKNEPLPVLRRPVEVVGIISEHPIRHDDGTKLRARIRSWRQGREIALATFDLEVTIPAAMSPPVIGSTVRLRGYLKRSAGFANRVGPGPGPWRLYLKSERFLKLEAPPSRLLALAGGLRRRAEVSLASLDSGGPGIALARALLLGDRSRLPKAWRQALKRSGLAHLLAVSGLHAGVLALILLSLATPLPSGWRWLCVACGLVVYLLLIGPRPAILRAASMGLLAIAAVRLERPPQALNALAACVLVLVLHDRWIVDSLGFQLSVAATAGILVLMPALARRWQGLPAALRRPVAATVAAQLATLPWILPLAGGVHWLAPLLNLIAMPYLAAFLGLAFFWLGVAAIWSSAAAATLPMLDAATRPSAALAALPPGAATFVPLAVGSAPALLLAAASVLAALRPRLALRLLVAIWLLVQVGAGYEVPPVPEIVMLDVGQGDAVVLRDGRHTLLVDGGGWPHGDLGGRVLVPALAALGISRLDAVALTHPDLDHCGGLVDLTRYLPVEEVWMGPGWLGDRCATELLTTPGTVWRVLWRGEVERLGRWSLRVLHPAAGQRQARNDRSLVMVAEVPGYRFWLTGDVAAPVERRLVHSPGRYLTSSAERRLDILKVAHHGSKTSTAEAFLRALEPRVALISSAPGNVYGHPHASVLKRLEAAGTRTLRTDRTGMIRLRLHREGLSIELPGAPRVIAEN